METLLNELKDICFKYQLTSLQRLIASAENLLAEKFIDIAIFGQFKAGKSSFINNFIGRDVLPTAVIPATSVITRIYYGEKEKIQIKFNDNSVKEIRLNELDEYVTELKNPNNIKDVAIANIEIPELKQYKRLCFVDTPGIGSIYAQNTQTTEDWSKEATIAVVCISAERPLSEFDMKLIKELNTCSYKQVCLLTKTDLFTTEQLKEIISFLRTSLQKEIGKNMDVFTYSIYKDTELYKKTFKENICNPLLERYDKEIEKIFQHKVLTIATNCLNYIEIAHKASLKTDDEKKLLKEKIFDEKINMGFIQQELRLITTDNKSRVRDTVYKIFDPYINDLIKELQNDFINEFPSWEGNLYRLTVKFQEWLKAALRERLKNIAEKEKPKFDKIMNDINSHFSFYTKSLKERLSENIYTVLGIKLAKEEWRPEFKPLKQPDISVYRVFDSHIELLWFLFPMFLFRKIFRKHFYKQVSFEVEKNIYRITSDISEIINKLTDYSKEETLKYIQNELGTIENVLSTEQSKSDEYYKISEKLKQKITDFTIS
jgi:GTP-binding protein EngB required for normal cell division